MHLSLSDRNIVRKELDLNTDSVLSDSDKQSIRDFYYSMNSPSAQNKSYVFLKPVNLTPFYIKPYFTHESEIKFAEAEMEKLGQMLILRRDSREFLSTIMFIKM